MKWNYAFILLLILVPLITLAYATQTLVSTVDMCKFDVIVNRSFGVSYPDQNIKVILTVLSGTFLGNGTINVELYSGSVIYYADASCQIQLNSSDPDVGFSVNDISSKGNSMVASISSGTNNVIRWNIPFRVWLPIHFALGGIGLAFLCIIPVLAIRKFRQKDYVWTLIYGSIGILVGIALIIAWLWI